MLPLDLEDNPGKYHCKKGSISFPLTKTLKFKIGSKRGVGVFEGVMGKEPVIVKWHQGRKNATDELEFYQWLGKKVPAAQVYPGWTLEGEEVLVMEKLVPLGEIKPDPVKLGVDVLKQLKRVHQRCVHNGIKPDNIMYRSRDDTYLLIDYGSIADQKLNLGFERKSWPVGWSSQPRKISDQATYFDNDLIELSLTLKSLSRNKKEKKLFDKMLHKIVKGYNRHRIRKWLRKSTSTR